MSGLGSYVDRLQVILDTLDLSKVDKSFLERALELLRKLDPAGPVPGSVATDLTTQFEVEFREVVSRFRRESLPPKRSGGVELVAAAVEAGLILTSPGPEPLFHLANYVFGVRNAPHHSNVDFEWESFTTLFFAANAVLVTLRDRERTAARRIEIPMAIQPDPCPFGTNLNVNAVIVHPDSGVALEIGRATAQLEFSNQSKRNYEMTVDRAVSGWSVAIATSGLPPGSYVVTVQFQDETDSFASRNATKGKLGV